MSGRPTPPHSASLQFAIAQTWLGEVIVAATDRGVCAIELGSDRYELILQLRARFPRRLLVESLDVLPWANAIKRYIDGDTPETSIPFSVEGTPFQKEIWVSLQRIPAGSTRSYAQLARELGRPSAVRAVARAIAANPLAVIVPCHRVVRSDGTLGGYRWGAERKRQLLEREQQRVQPPAPIFQQTKSVHV